MTGGGGLVAAAPVTTPLMAAGAYRVDPSVLYPCYFHLLPALLPS